MCSSDSQTGVFSAKAIRQILRGTAGAVLFSILILLPSVFMGTPQTLMNITSRVYVSVTLVGILSSGTSWNKLTGSMRTFRLPSIFIFTLDITLKYISVLGEICAAILTSVRLRSVGKNPQKAKALSGVLGISFLKSGEMAEEMHAAMCCRGFTGEYKKNRNTRYVQRIFSALLLWLDVLLVEFLQSFHNAGKTLITITHNRQLAETIGTRFACMNEEHELKMLS